MHTAISCASCRRPLRIPTELVGQTVRCPFCTDTFLAEADPSIQLEEAVLNKAAGHVEEVAKPERAVALLEPEPPVVEESFTVDLEGPVKVAPPKPWSTWVFVRSDSDRRLWGEMQAEISAEGLRLYRGRKELIVPVGCEATWVRGGRVRVVVGSRSVEFQIQKKHVYKSRMAADVAGFLNGERPMPVNKGYRWPWYQWLMLLAPLALIGVLIAGELPETPLKPLKGFGIFMFAFVAPVLAYIIWQIERLPVKARWTAASLVVGGVFLFTGMMYYFGPKLPPAAAYANWSKYTPDDGRWSIQMPAPSIVDHSTVSGINFTKHAARVKPNQMFIVAYADINLGFGLGIMNPTEYACSYGRQYITAEYPNAYPYGAEQPINLDDYAGKEITYNPGRGRSYDTMTVRMYLIEKRLYVLIVSETEGNNGRKFLDSFKPEGAVRNTLPRPIFWDGLTAYWSFDEANQAGFAQGQAVVEDTGTIPGARALNGCELTNGRRGKALHITEQWGACFDYGNSPRLNFKELQPFTIAGWFKTTSQSGVIVSQRNRRDAEVIIKLGIENGWLIADIHRDGGDNLNAARVNSQNMVADGAWHHFALVRDNLGNVTLYLDGQWQGGTSDAVAKGRITTDLRALGNDLYLQQFGRGLPFHGSVDEFCIFHRNLKPEEINQLAGKAR